MAVGAPLKRLARQLATEAGLLVVVSTAAGLLLSLWLTVLVQDLAFLRSPFWRDVSPFDWRVLGMTAGLMLVLTLLVSLAPVVGPRRLGIASSARSVVARAGVVLAGFGFYGTQRYLVSAVRREFAIRAAVGAGPRALGRTVLARALVLALPGFALGSLLGFMLVGWLRGELVSHHVSPYAIAFVVAIAIATLALGATLGPARQARRMRAGLVLREE